MFGGGGDFSFLQNGASVIVNDLMTLNWYLFDAGCSSRPVGCPAAGDEKGLSSDF